MKVAAEPGWRMKEWRTPPLCSFCSLLQSTTLVLFLLFLGQIKLKVSNLARTNVLSSQHWPDILLIITKPERVLSLLSKHYKYQDLLVCTSKETCYISMSVSIIELISCFLSSNFIYFSSFDLFCFIYHILSSLPLLLKVPIDTTLLRTQLHSNTHGHNGVCTVTYCDCERAI